MSAKKYLAPVFLVGVAASCSWLVGCGSDDTAGLSSGEDAAGTGGSGTGGAVSGSGGKGSGGKAGSGGKSGSGGAASSGGASNGGSVGTGGDTATGGIAGTGGAVGTGGAGTGGTGTGGTGTGGTGTGGTGTGGTGTGDAGTDGGLCGNGVLDPGEECEPPNSAFCDSSCQLGGACTACEELNCQGPSIHTDCTTGTGAALCIAALQCARENQCYEFDPGICYCGATDIVACQGSAGPAGPCIAAYNAAASGTAPGTVLLDLTDPATPLGRAGFIQQCDQAFCQVECF